MRIFGYFITGIFTVTMIVITTLLWVNYGPGLELAIPAALALIGLSFLIGDAASLEPKRSSSLPPGFYCVLAIHEETGLDFGKVITLKRWPDEGDEYGSPQVLCVRLNSSHKIEPVAVGMELEFLRRGSKFEFVRAPKTAAP